MKTWALIFLSASLLAFDVPPLTGPVVDQAGVLSSKELSALELGLRDFKDRVGPQLQVVILDRLDGEPIETASMKIAETWKIGSKAQDNGVLLTLAIQDRAWRIEVGGGLEGELTDAVAARIGRGVLVPALQQGRVGPALAVTLSALAAQLGGELTLPQGVSAPRAGRRASHSNFWFFIFVLFFFSIVLIFGRLSPLLGFLLGGSLRRGRTFGGFGGGGFGGGLRGGGWGGGGGGFSGGGASGRW